MCIANRCIGDDSGWPSYKWFHLTTVLSGTTGRIYVNGNMTAENTSMKPPTHTVKTWCRIGKMDGFCDGTGNVVVDELKFYNRALSESEIINDYNTNEPLV